MRFWLILKVVNAYFTNRKEGELALEHMFDRICKQEGIEHRRTQVAHLWTNGQVERMNRTIKQATRAIIIAAISS